ncbi:MAG: hypothetical protein SGJ19_25255 [Planctomycetia bacterium]|nr:hypothetical protein [Planctomycetia bacterium]
MSKSRALPPPATPRWQKLLIGSALALIAVAFLLRMLLRQAPEFYREELALSAAGQQAASDACLANITATVSQARRAGDWRAEFTEDELNGWLAYDLPNNHPELADEAVGAPRVDFEENRGQIAFEYRGLVTTYVNVAFDAEVRDQNTLAIRFLQLRGGAVPLPLGSIIEPMTSIAGQLGQPVQWTEEDGYPVALLTFVPSDAEKSEIELVQVSIEQDRIVLEGNTKARSGAPR